MKFKYHTSLDGYEKVFKIDPFADYALESKIRSTRSYESTFNKFYDLASHLKAVKKLYTVIT